MNSRLLVAFLCVAAILPGCVVNNGPRYSGDVTFRWSFGGLRCDDVRSVRGVNVTIDGELLANGGRYDCQANGFDGIVLHDFAPGRYPFHLVAVSYTNEVLYEARGSFVVDGHVTVNADLTPVGLPPSFAYLSWQFAPPYGPLLNCNQAGIHSVDVMFENGDSGNFDCWEGQGGNHIQTDYLAPGFHYVEFFGLDRHALPQYYFGGEIETWAGQPTSHTAELWAIGGAAIRWELRSFGGRPMNCGEAGVDRVGINFLNLATNQWVYGDVGDWHGCNDAPVTYEYLRPGRYAVDVYGRARDGREFITPNPLPVIDVVAHQFPGPNSALPVYVMQN